jgi:hypothetical protein
VLLSLSLFVPSALCCSSLSWPLSLLCTQVALMTETWIHREFGFFKKRWVATEDASMDYPYRPVAYLRLAVAGFRNFGLKGVPKTPPPFVRITLLPEGDSKTAATAATSAAASTGTGTALQEYHIATFSTSLDRHGLSSSAPSLSSLCLSVCSRLLIHWSQDE